MRLHSQSGIAIGVILFMLAVMAAMTIAFTAGSNFTGSTITPDRISKEIRSQGDLIRAKINECYMNFKDVNHSGGSYYDTANYPASAGAGTLVENLDCPTYGSGTQNLWTGQSKALLPPPPMGFDKWVYKNAGDSDGRCIRIQPSTGNATDSSIKQGLIEAQNGFSDMERVYDSGSVSQRFIIWITRPTGAAHADCSS